ncbi:TPA: hypothetical protein DCZ39_01120, partial [Patescibacteria group bacterium]|nr:hypothetical protein [Candidatus Gracilibacteria bacterium]
IFKESYIFFLSPFVKGETEGRGIYRLFLNPPVLRTTPPLKRRTKTKKPLVEVCFVVIFF